MSESYDAKPTLAKIHPTTFLSDLVDLERKGSKEMGFLQMVASIRQLLDIDLFDNYDRVYVVR